MQLRSLRRLLIDELQEVYISQELIAEEVKRMVMGADAPALKKAFEQHAKQTTEQLQRIETIFEVLGANPRGGHGKSMRALLSESEDRMGDGGDPHVVDAALLATARRIEHWEISSYSTALILAQRLELDKIPALLAQTLEEQQAMDASLADLAREMPVMGSEDNNTPVSTP